MSGKTKSGETSTEKIRVVCAVLLKTTKPCHIRPRFHFFQFCPSVSSFSIFTVLGDPKNSFLPYRPVLDNVNHQVMLFDSRKGGNHFSGRALLSTPPEPLQIQAVWEMISITQLKLKEHGGDRWNFTSISFQFHIDSTAISPRHHFEDNSTSLRFHFEFTLSSLRSHFER